MDYSTSLEIYQAQTLNANSLSSVKEKVNRVINHSLRTGDMPMVNAQTKILVLVYNAWSEALFSKIIHTPYGFSSISEIETINKGRNIEEKWKICIDIAIEKIKPSTGMTPDLKSRTEQIKKWVDRFIVEPRQIRNRIAHGQWVNALNSKSTAKNEELSTLIELVDVVEVNKWFEIHHHLAQVVEDVIESKKTFHRDYWTHLTNIQSYLEKTKDWTVETKTARLRAKPIKFSGSK